jgi:hypothetical protein
MHQDASPQTPQLSLLSTIRFGLLVVFSEIKWCILLAFRNWEISQLRKRLNQEFHNLGLAEAAIVGLDVHLEAVGDDIFNEKDLALKQVSFLSDEIKHLMAQLETERQEYVRRRVQAWGL